MKRSTPDVRTVWSRGDRNEDNTGDEDKKCGRGKKDRGRADVRASGTHRVTDRGNETDIRGETKRPEDVSETTVTKTARAIVIPTGYGFMIESGADGRIHATRRATVRNHDFRTDGQPDIVKGITEAEVAVMIRVVNLMGRTVEMITAVDAVEPASSINRINIPL